MDVLVVILLVFVLVLVLVDVLIVFALVHNALFLNNCFIIGVKYVKLMCKIVS